MNFILVLGILLVLGLASTRVMKVLKLPNVTGYLIVGLLTALACLLIDRFSNSQALTNELISLNETVSGVALGFIALSIGEEFKFLLKVLIVVGIPSVLTFIEPDTGAVLIYFIITIVMLFVGGFRARWFIITLTTIGLIGAVFLGIYFNYFENSACI